MLHQVIHQYANSPERRDVWICWNMFVNPFRQLQLILEVAGPRLQGGQRQTDTIQSKQTGSHLFLIFSLRIYFYSNKQPQPRQRNE